MTTTTTRDATAVAEAFASAYAAGDDDTLRELLHARVHQREIIPGAVVEYHRAQDTIAECREFRAAYDRIDVLVNEIAPVGDLLRWTTRWRLDRAGTRAIVEFHAFLTVDGRRITAIDAICSGVRPEES